MRGGEDAARQAALGRPAEPRADAPATTDEALATLRRLADVSALLGVDETLFTLARLAPPAATRANGSAAHQEARQLRRAEARFRALIEQIPAVTFLASLSGDENEIYVSPQIESLLGFTQEEWVSNPILWYEQLHPEDRDRLVEEFAGLCLTGGPFHGVLRVFTRSGELRWVHAEAQIVRDDQVGVLFLLGVGFDITEQVHGQAAREQLVREQAAHAEVERERQRLQELFTALPAAIAVLSGPEHTIEFLNPVAAALAGAAEPAVGRTWQEVFPDFGEEIIAALDSVFTRGRSYSVSEHRVVSARWGGERFFDLICHPLADLEGSAPQVLVHATDVTEQVLARRGLEQQMSALAALNAALKETAEARDQALTALQESLRTREEFLSAAAHDLKTPLAIIKGTTQVLQRRAERTGVVEADRLQDGLAAIAGGANRMTALVNQLLDLTRMELDQPLSLELQPVDLVALAQRVLAEQQRVTTLHQLRFNAAVAELVGEWDAGRLERVLGNLLDNAIKYSPEGGEIVLTVGHEYSTEGEWAVIQLQDYGLGIPAADLPRLFDRFHRGSNVVGRIPGTGIGLTGASQIVASHGGTLTVESEEGAGSTFTVRLPLNREGNRAAPG